MKVEIVKVTTLGHVFPTGEKETVLLVVCRLDPSAWSRWYADMRTAALKVGEGFDEEAVKRAFLDLLTESTVDMQGNRLVLPVDHVSNDVFNAIKKGKGL